MAETDIAKRAAFDTIRYAQVWEDADILVEALRPKKGDTVVSIASAGDNALALLAEGPDRVIAVDLNPAQLACLRIRIEAYRSMHHIDLLELMGSRSSGRRTHLLEQAAKNLSDEDQKFWAARKDRVVKFGLGGIGKFESYFRTFREWVLPFIHNRETIDELLRPREAESPIRLNWTRIRIRVFMPTWIVRILRFNGAISLYGRRTARIRSNRRWMRSRIFTTRTTLSTRQ
jgi:S-adenosylmethionine-diacylglycerol 3-amino-3-carboxypropyl transferase